MTDLYLVGGVYCVHVQYIITGTILESINAGKVLWLIEPVAIQMIINITICNSNNSLVRLNYGRQE